MPSPREFVPDIPRSVEQIVLKCCEKSPDRRYQNMTELIADLKQSLIHPNADFVKVINPDEDGATRMANPVEQSEIRRRSGTGPLTYEENLPQDDGAARRESTAGERGYAREHSYPPAYEENSGNREILCRRIMPIPRGAQGAGWMSMMTAACMRTDPEDPDAGNGLMSLSVRM